MKKNKKKIGWWRWLAKAFGLPLLGIGREAVTEFVEEQPVKDFATLSIDITEDILEIYTDLIPENKKQMKALLDHRDEELIMKTMALLLHLIPKVLTKIGKGEETTLEENKLLRVYKAISTESSELN